MPKNLIDLRDRRVVITLFTVAAGIIVLNWRVFQPLRAKNAMRSRQQQEEILQVPADLGEMVGFAAAQLASDRPAGARERGSPPERAVPAFRDPFRKRTPAMRTGTDRSGRKRGELSCTAILISGNNPTAMIKGKLRHQGDRFDGYLVEEISLDGVRLAKDGKRIFLAVIKKIESNNYHPVVTGPGRSKDKADP